MKTHAAIGIRIGYLLKYVALHSDGYFSYTGSILMKYYNTQEKASALVNLGTLAMLRERIAPNPGEVHTFFNPIRDSETQKRLAKIEGKNPNTIPDGILGVTSSYWRDLGGNRQISELTSTSLDTAVIDEIEQECSCRYVYVFDVETNAWYYSGPETICDGIKTFKKMFVIDSFRYDYSFLSNFYILPSKLNFHGYKFTNTEAAFQAMKCLERAREFEHLTPSQAKRLGRQLPLVPNWDFIKRNVMYEVIAAKFNQFPHLRQKLLDTAPAVLIEGNTWGDTYWGCVKGEGKNTLGILLMQLRDELSK